MFHASLYCIKLHFCNFARLLKELTLIIKLKLMNKKLIVYLLFFLVSAAPALAQKGKEKEKKVDTKHTNFFKYARIETEDYIVEIVDIIGRM